MPAVIIDTNAVIPDYKLRGPHWTTLSQGIQTLGIAAFIPEIVVDELSGNYNTHLSSVISKLRSQIKNLRDLGIELPSYDKPLSEISTDYLSFLTEFAKTNNIEVISYPDLTIKKLVSTSYEGKKPFKRHGEGFKDYIVWQSVLSLLSKGEKDIHLITNNSKDFCGEDGSLHSDLEETLVGFGVSVQIHENMKSFIDLKISPFLEELSDIIVQISNDSFIGFETQSAVHKCIEEKLFNHPLQHLGLKFPRGLNDASLIGHDEVEIRNIDVRRLSEQELVIEIKIISNFHFECIVDARDLSNFSDNNENIIFKSFQKMDEEKYTASIEEKLELLLYFIFDEEGKFISNSAVSSIEKLPP